MVGFSGIVHTRAKPLPNLPDTPIRDCNKIVNSESFVLDNYILCGSSSSHSFANASQLKAHNRPRFPSSQYNKMAATNNTKSVDRRAIVGEATKLMFESDTLEDPRTRSRTVPFEVICPGMPRTGTSCKTTLFQSLAIRCGTETKQPLRPPSKSSAMAQSPICLPLCPGPVTLPCGPTLLRPSSHLRSGLI